LILESLEKLQGVRTTLCFIILLIGYHVAFFIGKINPAEYIEITKWSWGIYTGAKAVYKGTEIVKAKKNGTTGASG
jgi:hypothetical protein